MWLARSQSPKTQTRTDSYLPLWLESSAWPVPQEKSREEPIEWEMFTSGGLCFQTHVQVTNHSRIWSKYLSHRILETKWDWQFLLRGGVVGLAPGFVSPLPSLKVLLLWLVLCSTNRREAQTATCHINCIWSADVRNCCTAGVKKKKICVDWFSKLYCKSRETQKSHSVNLLNKYCTETICAVILGVLVLSWIWHEIYSGSTSSNWICLDDPANCWQ